MESTPQLQHFLTWSDLDLHNHNASRKPFGSQKPQMGTYWTAGLNARLSAPSPPPLSLSRSMDIFFFFLLPGKALQNTSLSEQVISCLRLPQPTFEKCAKITFAALDWPQKIFEGSCYAFRRNHVWPFLQKNLSYLGVSRWVCPADWNLGPPITESQQLLVCVSVYQQTGSFQKLLESF